MWHHGGNRQWRNVAWHHGVSAENLAWQRIIA